MAARTALTVGTTLTTQTMNPTAESADLVWTTADASNGNVLTITGKEILLVKNSAVSAKTVTIAGVADSYGRTGSITAYSVGASKIALFGPFNTAAFSQSTANDMNINGETTDISFSVVRFP